MAAAKPLNVAGRVTLRSESFARVTMRRLVEHIPSRPAQAFTLLELLLTMVLLGFLLGAMVFNFGTLDQGKNLSEGANRFETMLRYARSHAAYVGRVVRLTLAPLDPGLETLDTPKRDFILEWEPDPLGAPGQFATLRMAAWDVDSLQAMVAIESLTVPRPLVGRSMPAFGQESGVVVAEALRGTDLAVEPSLTFYPDGASDSARIILVSRDGEDTRKRLLQWEGLTGTVDSSWLDVESIGITEPELTESEAFTSDAEEANVNSVITGALP